MGTKGIGEICSGRPWPRSSANTRGREPAFRLSMLKLPAPKTKTWSSPPAIEIFFRKFIIWLGSAKLLWKLSAAATEKIAITAATMRAWNPLIRSMPPPNLDNYGDDVSNHRERQMHGVDVTHCHRRRRDFSKAADQENQCHQNPAAGHDVRRLLEHDVGPYPEIGLAGSMGEDRPRAALRASATHNKS